MKIWKMLVLITAIFALLVPSASASAESGGEVFCSSGHPYECKLVPDVETRTVLQQKAAAREDPIAGVYWQRGKYVYRAHEDWDVIYDGGHNEWIPGKAIPHTFYFQLGDHVSLLDGGVFVNDDTLTYHEPGYSGEGEIGYEFPNNASLVKTLSLKNLPLWEGEFNYDEPFSTSYAFDGSSFISIDWQLHDAGDGYIRLDIYSYRYVFLEMIERLPKDTSSRLVYTDLENFDTVPGEGMTLIDGYYGTRWADPRLYRGSPTFRVFFVWKDGYKVQRDNGDTFLVSTYGIRAEAACLPENHCYSYTTSDIPLGMKLFVDPIKAGWAYDWDDLPLLSAPPYSPLTAEEKEILTQRVLYDEVTIVEGVVKGPSLDLYDKDPRGYFSITLKDGSEQTVSLTSGFMPPIGTRVRVYTYKNYQDAEGAWHYVAPKGDWGWGIMAVEDLDRPGNYWFFNGEAEGFQRWDPIYRPRQLAAQ